MPAVSLFRMQPHRLATLILLVGLLATWFAYAPGMGGALHFDDESNLRELESVNNPLIASRFITSGQAGPLGRPIALASFVPQAYAWPHSTEVLLRTNILIHLLNGLLVTWFLFLLGRARKQSERSATLVAVGASAIWMLMPLLASSSLFIVQRMTTLSAVFALAGAIGYMYARESIERRPRAALYGMTLALAIGGGLSALAKENGILLPLFILAVEFTLLKRPSSIQKRTWNLWFSIVLVAPLAIVLFYIAAALPYPESIAVRRQFTGFERLITQAEILWKYLYLAFLPNVTSLGPFHDDYTTQRSVLNPVTLLSIGGWVITIVGAFVLRRRAPLFSFAVAWYLLGHLLESTTLNLELYFEHRNYMPLIGPVYALIASLSSLRAPWKRIAILSVSGYAIVLAVTLASVSSLWGTPRLAAEMWQVYKPMSRRANVFLAQTLTQDHDPYTAHRVLEKFLDANPDDDGVRLYILGMSCQLEPDKNHEKAIIALERRLSITDFSYLVPSSFEYLTKLTREGVCKDISGKQVYSLGSSILQNPQFDLPIIVHNINVLLSRITFEDRDFGATMWHVEQALDSMYVPSTLRLAVNVLNSGGRFDLSRDLLLRALDRNPPKHPLRAAQWKQERVMFKAMLEATEAMAAAHESTLESES